MRDGFGKSRLEFITSGAPPLRERSLGEQGTQFVIDPTKRRQGIVESEHLEHFRFKHWWSSLAPAISRQRSSRPLVFLSAGRRPAFREISTT
jgi:hypothetical protein